MTLTAIRPPVVVERARRVVERRRRLPRGPIAQLAGRVQVVGLVVATGLCGLLFGPVFGSFFALIVPVGVVCAVTYFCFEAAHLWAPLERWRPLLTVFLGLLVIGRSGPRGLYDGARRSWLLTLQSTWPVRLSARLDMFAPLLVLATLLIGVQILLRTRARVVALLPGVAIALVAQGFQPLSGHVAVPVVLVFTAAAALVLGSLDNVRIAAVVTIPVVVGGAFAGVAIDPAGNNAYSLKSMATPVTTPTAVTNPLDDIAYRLEHPTTPMFSVHGGDADRWPLAVFTKFDGANWMSTPDYRYLGGALDIDPTSLSSKRQSAEISIQDLPGPWLPGQRGLRSVSGVSPLVDETNGTLLYDGTTPGLTYRVGWAVPDISGSRLADSPLAQISLGSMGRVPAGIMQIAKTAAGNAAPSFRTALVLERYLREHYRLAVGRQLPAGHGWPQLLQFLNQTKRGTSEQFAAAYVALARVIGIPARLVVGFRAPSAGNVVRNGDVLAWPEVAVSGVGWIPLDPSGMQRAGAAHDSTPLSRATDQARAELPPQSVKKPPPQHTSPPPPAAHSAGQPGPSVPVTGTAVLLLGACALWLIGVPLAKEIRAGGRRRRGGNAAVVAAWSEARDRLRDNGIPIHGGMTVRDVALASRGRVGRSAEHALEQLGHLVDAALWSGGSVSGRGVDIAWRSCDTVRVGLAARPLRRRIAAAVGIRSLRRLR